MLEIVAGIGDHGQRSVRQHAIEAERQLGAADPARQREHAHRKRSCSAGRTRAAAGWSGADQARPRTSTIGIASSACPIRIPAAAAISSAKPVSLTSNSRPKRSGRPRRSTNAGNPAAPSATPTVPLRQGRPKLSLIMTPSPTPKTLIRYCRKAWAEPSGSTGRSSTRSPPSSSATFEWSMPALAITKPRRCSTISRPGRWRTTRFDSDSTTSTNRGSLSTSAASAVARSDGSTVAISTYRPSALETIFCATTSTSPSRGTTPLSANAAIATAPRSSPGCIKGMPASPVMVTRTEGIVTNPPGPSPELGAQQRQHLFGVKPQEAGLIGAGSVEHEVGEAELDIGPDLRQLLLGVGGDDPAARRPFERQCGGEPLHLERILDVHLLLRRQRERRPVPRILHRPVAVGVERDLDLDHPFDAVARAPGALQPFLDLGQQGVTIEGGALATGADEPFHELAGHRRGGRARSRDPDRHRGLRPVVNRRSAGAVILALEGHPLRGPQPSHQQDRLAQPTLSLAEARPFDAGRRDVVQRLAGADAKDDSVRKHRAERADRLRHDRGMVAKGRRRNAGADLHPRCLGAERAEPGERKRRVSVGMLPRLKVVADEDRVKADRLGQTRELQQLARPELFG